MDGNEQLQSCLAFEVVTENLFHADKGGTGCEASIMKPTMCLLNIKWNSHNIDIAYSF